MFFLFFPSFFFLSLSQRKISSICSVEAYRCFFSTAVILSAGLRGLHVEHCPLGRGAELLGELRAQIGGAETEGAGEEKWGAHVPPNITAHHFPVHLSVTELCIDAAAGASMALPKEDVQYLGWAGAAGTPGSWHPHRLWKDVSWLHYIPDTCCQGFEGHISFLSGYSGCAEKNVPFPPRMKVFREAKGLESIISLFVLSCLD